MYFYLVGILLFAIPISREIFIWLTPWVLLLSLGIMLFYHKHWNPKTIFLFLLIYLLSFLLEMRGTSDARIFGSYFYMDTLGVKIKHTPLIIGINWLMLLYGSRALIYDKIKSPIARILVASLLMIIYDLIVEIAAPIMGMWEFNQAYPPLQNFIMWLIASLFFHSLLEFFKIKISNPRAGILFVAQIFFFAIISAYILIFA